MEDNIKKNLGQVDFFDFSSAQSAHINSPTFTKLLATCWLYWPYEQMLAITGVQWKRPDFRLSRCMPFARPPWTCRSFCSTRRI